MLLPKAIKESIHPALHRPCHPDGPSLTFMADQKMLLPQDTPDRAKAQSALDKVSEAQLQLHPLQFMTQEMTGRYRCNLLNIRALHKHRSRITLITKHHHLFNRRDCTDKLARTPTIHHMASRRQIAPRHMARVCLRTVRQRLPSLMDTDRIRVFTNHPSGNLLRRTRTNNLHIRTPNSLLFLLQNHRHFRTI